MKKFTYFLGIAFFIYLTIQTMLVYPDSLLQVLQLYVPAYVIVVSIIFVIKKRNPRVAKDYVLESYRRYGFKGRHFDTRRLFEKNTDTSLWFAPGLNCIMLIVCLIQICKTRYYFKQFKASRSLDR